MAGKRSVAEVALRSTGGAQVQKTLDGVGKATERVGRQQTRLGQASASAGRQFSAQASGLGGLVAAYAGAAATVFAITAAFTALNAAARAEQTITGVNALANAVGESGPQIIKGLQEITKGQLSIVQTAELANLALSSGFSADQINNLAEISLKASRALGRDLTDSFNRLTRGVTKLEPELLDELGIFTRIEPAVEKYAARVGKTASQLSNFERRQAFANAVAEEGAEKFRDIDTTADTTSQSLEQLSATVADLGQKVGAFIARVIAPLADAISGNLVASVGAFGILAKFVFGTTLREAQTGIENFNSTIESRSLAIVDKLGGSSKQVALANDQLSQSLAKVNLRVRAVSSANEQEFKTLIQLGRQNQLTAQQTQRLQQIIEQETASVNKLSASLTKANMTTLQLEKAQQRLTNRTQQLKIAQDAVAARLAATPKLAAAAATGFRVVAAALTTVTGKLLSLFNTFTLIVTIVSVLAVVGSTVLDAFGWLDPIVESVNKLIRSLRVLLDITKESGAQRDAGQALTSGLIGDPDATFVQKGLPILGDTITNEDFQGAVIDAIKAGKTETQAEFNKFIGDSFKLNSTQRAAIQSDLEAVFSGIQFATGGTLQGLAEFAEATGRTLKSVIQQTKVLEDGSLQFNKANELGLEIITRRGAILKDTSQLTGKELKLAREFNEVQIDRLQAQEVSANLAEALASGAATAEQIEKRRGAIVAKIANLEKERADLTGQAAIESQRLTDDLTAQLQILNKSADLQLAILRTRDQIRKTFSAQISAAGKVTQLFTVENDTVRLTTTAVEKRQAQVMLLQEALELGKEDLAARRAGVELDGVRAQRAQLAADAQKALTGEFLQAVDAAEKLADTLEKIVRTNISNTEQARQQLTIARLQAQESDIARQERASTVQAARDVAALERTRKRAKLEQDILKAGRERRKLAVDRALERGLITEEQGRVFKLSLAKEAQTALENFTKQEIENLKEKARIETENQRKIIETQRALLGGDETRGLIDQRIEAERKLQNERIDAQANAQITEIRNLEEQNKLIVAQLQGFKAHTDAMAEILAADITARRELSPDFATNAARRAGEATGDTRKALVDAFGGEQFFKAAVQGGFTNTQARMAENIISTNEVQPQVTSQIGDLADRLSKADFSAAIASVENLRIAQKELSDFQLNEKGSQSKLAAEEKVAAAQDKIKVIADELGISVDSLNLKLMEGKDAFDNYLAQVSAANHTMLQLKMGIRDSLVDGLGNGLNTIFQNIADGKPALDNMGEVLRNTFENVRKQVLEKTLVKPLQDKLTGTLNSMFGINEKGADNAEVVNGALKTTSVDDQGQALIPKLKEEGVSAFDTIKAKLLEFKDSGIEAFQTFKGSLGEVFTSIGQGATSIFKSIGGEGGILQSIGGLFGGGGSGGGIGSFFSGIFGGGVAGASGGFVPFSAYQRLAAGGQARDRVPALLEPGEFVMKRSSANSIGAPALNQMNATGKAGGNVVVNIQNQGTPQDATASEPRFDGEKFVIDIVTRDLRNNGPIRKSLRGGGA